MAEGAKLGLRDGILMDVLSKIGSGDVETVE